MKRKTWLLAGAAVLGAVTATGGVVAMSSAAQAGPAAQEPPPNTAQAVRGKLSAMVSLDGTLTYRARSDGSPYSVINQDQGTYTRLPDDGDRVDRGDVLPHDKGLQVTGQLAIADAASLPESVRIGADEPTGALDSRTGVEIMAIRQRLNREGSTIVLVTHEPEIAAFRGRTVAFRDGRVISDRVAEHPDSAKEALKAWPVDPTAALAEDADPDAPSPEDAELVSASRGHTPINEEAREAACSAA